MITTDTLVCIAMKAVQEGWWYILGGYINDGSKEQWLDAKIAQYSYNQKYEADIRAYVKRCIVAGKRPIFSDCYGLIKGAAWYDPAKGVAVYQKDGHLDRNQAGALRAAQYAGGLTQEQNRGRTWGEISTLPEEPGICLFKNGHAGIYVGAGWFVHIFNTKNPALKVRVRDYNWTHWFRDTYVIYGGGDIMWEILPGDKNIAVGLMQALFVLDGYDMGIWGPDGNGTDGSCGTYTQGKILEFKKNNGLPAVDSVFREADWRKLYKNVQVKLANVNQEEIAALKKQIADLTQQLAVVKGQLDDALQVIVDTEKELADTQGALNKANTDLDAANVKLDGARGAVKTLNAL